QAYRTWADREHAVSAASRQLVLADTQLEVVDGVAHAVGAMLPAGSASTVELVDMDQPKVDLEPDAPTDVMTVTIPLSPNAADNALPAVLPPAASEAGRSALRVSASAGDLVELDPVLRGLVDQAASALRRIELSADMRAGERERYFRTLVLTSDDVTLIS